MRLGLLLMCVLLAGCEPKLEAKDFLEFLKHEQQDMKAIVAAHNKLEDRIKVLEQQANVCHQQIPRTCRD